MQYVRSDEIWEIECDWCRTRLTEQIESPMPTEQIKAQLKAFEAGWQVLSNQDTCGGCLIVQK